MPTVKNVEKRIWDKEGFDVVIKKDGKNVRGDKKDFPQWNGKIQSKNDMTVKEWKNKFSKQYPGYEVEILDGDGSEVHGSTKLGTVRDTYNIEEC